MTVFQTFYGFSWYSKELGIEIDITDMKTLCKEVPNHNDLMELYKKHKVRWHFDPVTKTYISINKTGFNYPEDVLKTKEADCLETATFSNEYSNGKNIESTIGFILPFVIKENNYKNEAIKLTGHAFNIFKHKDGYYVFNYRNEGNGDFSGPYKSKSEAAKDFGKDFTKIVFEPKEEYEKAIYYYSYLEEKDLKALNNFIKKADPSVYQYKLMDELKELNAIYNSYIYSISAKIKFHESNLQFIHEITKRKSVHIVNKNEYKFICATDKEFKLLNKLLKKHNKFKEKI